MGRCLELARSGAGNTYPNPMVGAVIVHNDKIIGEGWHQRAGEAHAEVVAINAVADTSKLKDSTLYVNLEPCSHHGRTPPCADLIVRSKIPRVVVGSLDPNPAVAGNGIARLRDAGCEVSVGVLEAECDELNKRFFTYHRKRRPYIILKWAQSGDGFLAPSERNGKASVPVTNIFSHQLVHKMRAREMAIMVGARTLQQDDPMLNVRHWAGNDPVPVVLSARSELDLKNKLFDQDRRVFILGNPNIQASGQVTTLGQGPLSAREVASILYEQGFQSVLVEGGKEVLELFIEAGLWDEAWIFKAPYRHFYNGTKSPVFDSRPVKEVGLRGDLLEIHKHIAH